MNFARLALAWALGVVGLLAGLYLSGAVPRRILRDPVPLALIAAWSVPPALTYLLLRRWLGDRWWRLAAAATVGVALLGALSGKIWWSGDPAHLVTAARYTLGAALGAATGFWAGLRLIAPRD